MDKGWIKLHRTIRNHWLWPQKKFSPFEAWIDLIMSANHVDAQVLIDGKLITVLRGSFITSELKLAARWGWARKTVHRFLDVLKKDKMVTTVATTKYTAITLTNYRVYQGDGATLGTTMEHENIQVGCKTLPTNKNTKNVRMIRKNIYGSFQNVLLTEEEYERLKSEFDCAADAIEFLSAYIAEKGYKSKSHNLAIRRWVIDAVRKKKPRQTSFSDLARGD